jgi:hypothetical protein
MALSDPNVGVITLTQATASAYDRGNTSIITNLVPQDYLIEEGQLGTAVLQNLLYLLARNFDELKVHVDQIPNILLPSYTGFDETPDALLEDALQFWGWDTKANFLSAQAFQ